MLGCRCHFYTIWILDAIDLYIFLFTTYKKQLFIIMMHFKNVLCVYPHQKGLPEKKYCPPIGLEYIATILEDLVEKVTIIDMRFEPNIDNFIKDDNVDMVCLSVNWDYQRDAALNIVARIPPKIKVVLGGRYACD